MGVRILEDKQDNKAVFYCSTTGWAFGPVFESYEEADGFQKWLLKDARLYLDSELAEKHAEFRRKYVCECGTVADGKPGEDPDSLLIAGMPSDGKERFVCNYCHPSLEDNHGLEPRHQTGCICADCSGAELTAEND